MKKLFIISAIAACAIVSQASSVKWTASQVKDGDTVLSGVAAYLFDVNDYADADALASAIAGGTLDTSKAVISTTTTSTGAINKTQTTTYDAGTTQTFIGVIFNNADAGQATKYIITPATQVTIKTSGATGVGNGSQAGATWNPVPEPTTVALLALGLAALGLKRKVA